MHKQFKTNIIMENQTILEGNKLIAEFIGFKKSIVYTSEGKQYDFFIPNGFTLIKETETTIEGEWCEILMEQDSCMIDDLKFQSSWDWLMPVIEKISNIRNFLYPDGIYKFLVNVQIEITTKAFILKPSYNFPPDMDEPTVPTIEYYEKDLITNCWLGVIQFIKWYNQQQFEK